MVKSSHFSYETKPYGYLRKLVQSGKQHLIDVTTSSDENPISRPPSLIIQYTNWDHWASGADSNYNQFIQIHVKSRRIFLTAYSYENRFSDSSQYTYVFNKNWKFLCSNDGNTWEEQDVHVNDSILGKENAPVFQINKPGFFSFFRIQNTGPNHYEKGGELHPITSPESTILYVKNVDLFGFGEIFITSQIGAKYPNMKPLIVIIILTVGIKT